MIVHVRMCTHLFFHKSACAISVSDRLVPSFKRISYEYLPTG